MARRQQVVFEDPADQSLVDAVMAGDPEPTQEPIVPPPGPPPSLPPDDPAIQPPERQGDEPGEVWVPGQSPPKDPPVPLDKPIEEDTGKPRPTDVPFAQPEVLYPAPRTPSGRNPSPLPAAEAVMYQQRIKVLEAYQYKGKLADAPSWVDRNWAAYADRDDIRGISAGPAVRVPGNGGGATICRIGDFIVREEVAIVAGVTDIRVAVWSKDQFEKMFFPVPMIEGEVIHADIPPAAA